MTQHYQHQLQNTYIPLAGLLKSTLLLKLKILNGFLTLVGVVSSRQS